MVKKKSIDIWFEAAFNLFAEIGPEALNVKTLSEACGLPRSNFYYHFTDKEELIDQLLDYHMKNAAQTMLYELENNFNNYIPDFYDILAKNEQSLRFHWQLFKNRDNIKYNQIFYYLRKRNSKLIIPKVIDYYQLGLPTSVIETIWDTLNDAWLASLDLNDLSSKSMGKKADDIMRSILRFTKYQHLT
ncbi:TetR/AcrR family transcriptional regulator [Maribellus sediminis]|uniref:TetR/AcrR family transcriptional regulator n=1 Tax=Maribellus sediminis TaxID=2696285 RepID=UPI001430350E|nr:TetR/AcrR family transcriptional regulator [Maribellus sediminis]